VAQRKERERLRERERGREGRERERLADANRLYFHPSKRNK